MLLWMIYWLFLWCFMLQFIRFLRRNEGVEAARKYFLDARKSPDCSYHVYVAYALIAFCLDKDSKVFLLARKEKEKMELLYGSFMLFITLIGNEQHLLIYANQGRLSKLMILMLYILADRAQYFWSRIETLHAWTSVHSGVSSAVLLIWVLAYIWFMHTWPWAYRYWNVCFWNCYLSGIPYLWLLIFMVVTWDADVGNCVISLVTWTKLDGASLCSVMKKGGNTSTKIDVHDCFIC